MTKRYCLLLDLVDDDQLIREYEDYHQKAWPEVIRSIRDSGILSMEIYRFGNRLSMMMETTDEFSFSRKAEMDQTNPKVREWEELMWKYQKALPGAKEGEKWVLAEKIFDTKEIGRASCREREKNKGGAVAAKHNTKRRG